MWSNFIGLCCCFVRVQLLFLAWISLSPHRKPLGTISRAHHWVSTWLPHILFRGINFPLNNIILPFYLPYFGSSYSHHLIINLPLDLFHSIHIFPIQKRLSLSLSLSLKNFFFSFFVGFYYYDYYFSCISTLDWWMFVFFRILFLISYNWKMKSMKNKKYF